MPFNVLHILKKKIRKGMVSYAAAKPTVAGRVLVCEVHGHSRASDGNPVEKSFRSFCGFKPSSTVFLIRKNHPRNGIASYAATKPNRA